ncbi:MAG: type II toxin-antitoxin system RelE/ParE family toxin [Lachnospiraceae bacterium]|nr:type II toxin-antitoxin system RelE/ParE family toxin [Lachnospiraceae bacterium]
MKKLVFSALVRNKLKVLKVYLSEHYDPDFAKKTLAQMIDDAEVLKKHEKSGTNIAEMYSIDTEYWYLFTNHHYLIYRFDSKAVTIVQMFHEREDFMMKLFGISGRTQESIDYWGE